MRDSSLGGEVWAIFGCFSVIYIYMYDTLLYR